MCGLAQEKDVQDITVEGLPSIKDVQMIT
ncbi:protein of unknown function [Citrobacter amalonaticus]|nr:protein of unknown function [Citrobacter amalonaticus]